MKSTGHLKKKSGENRLQSSCNRIPIHQLPEVGDVIGPNVLFIEVIGMFPHIAGKQWF